MTFSELVFWIIVAIIAFFLFKVGLVILIIVIVLIVLYYIFNRTVSPTPPVVYSPYYEGYNQVLTYTDPYSQYLEQQTFEQNNDWYIPVQDYYDEKQNGYILRESFNVSPSTSEYCVNKQLQQTGNLELAISKCQVPAKSSGLAPACDC